MSQTTLSERIGYKVIELRREGFQSLRIRNKKGFWEVLEYTDRYGTERWKQVDEAKYNVEEHIQKYGVVV